MPTTPYTFPCHLDLTTHIDLSFYQFALTFVGIEMLLTNNMLANDSVSVDYELIFSYLHRNMQWHYKVSTLV